VDANGYADLVVVYDYATSNNKFVAYVTDAVQDVFNNPLGAGYYVYKVGETAPTTVYVPASASANDKTFKGFDMEGLYEIEVNDQNQIVSIGVSSSGVRNMAGVTYTSVGKADQIPATTGTYYNRAEVKAAVVGNSLQVTTLGSGGTAADYNVTSDTKVIKVIDKDNTDKVSDSLVAGTLSDLAAGDVVIVASKTLTAGSKTDADVIYVLVDETVTQPAGPGIVTYGVALDASKNLVVTRYVDGVATADGNNATNFTYVTYTSTGATYVGGTGNAAVSATYPVATINLTLATGNTYYVVVTINGTNYTTNSLTV
jgi:hypothetical protein